MTRTDWKRTYRCARILVTRGEYGPENAIDELVSRPIRPSWKLALEAALFAKGCW